MKKFILVLSLLLVLLCVSGCAKKEAMSGHYKAVNPPTDSGEMVIEELAFDGENVTMISGSVQQSVKYQIKDGQFSLITKYGTFDYQYEQKPDGTLVIDGVDYVKD